MNEDFYEKADELGFKYWCLFEKTKNLENEMKKLEKIQHTIKSLERNLEKYSENSIMRSRIENKIKKLRGQIEEIEKIDKEYNDTKQGLWELTSKSFEIDPEGERKFSKKYIQAINHLLFNDDNDKLEFHKCIITPEGITIDEDDVNAIITCANICDFIRKATDKKMGKETDLYALWDQISGSEKMFRVYSILANTRTIMNAKEISKIINDPEWNATKVNSDLNNMLLDHLYTHKLIMRVERGKYKISDIGRFLWQEYSSSNQQEIKLPKSDNSQSILNKWTKQIR